jgi:hypothetical protein
MGIKDLFKLLGRVWKTGRVAAHNATVLQMGQSEAEKLEQAEVHEKLHKMMAAGAIDRDCLMSPYLDYYAAKRKGQLRESKWLHDSSHAELMKKL